MEGSAASPNDWMRAYFRQARAIYRLTVLFDEVPRAKSIWTRWLGARAVPAIRPRISKSWTGEFPCGNPDSVEDPRVMFRLFELVARHDLKLTAETENAVEAALPRIQKWNSTSPDLWEYFRKILVLPYAASALRAMHRVGLLVLLFKEFQAIDSLVIRDYYHRYTVDEHSLVTIENLHSLRVEKRANWTAGSATFFPRWSTRNCFIYRCCFTTSARACPTRATWTAAWKR